MPHLRLSSLIGVVPGNYSGQMIRLSLWLSAMLVYHLPIIG